ncbi:MAG TPA: amino acid adenylation domain-containing protein, partial [Bryobacteraceae bacterium]|nr:amino acid adenylation domain-containing protein [Bryobacteraceae bacterium]
MTTQGQLSESKRKLLERVLRGEIARETWEAPIQPREPGSAVPLAPSQQQVWLHSQMAGTRYLYNETFTIHYHGALQPEAFERAFHEFLRRHEIWRATFPQIDGQVLQVVNPDLRLEIPFDDLTELPEDQREAEANRAALLDARRPFDLAVGPLLRGHLFKLRDADYRFYVALHHLIFDGVSLHRTVLPELAAIYHAFAAGEPSPLPEPRLQYADFALWQQRWQHSASTTEQVNYWRERLSEPLPVLQLPADRARPPMPSGRGAVEKLPLSSELSSAVGRRSKTESVTPYMFLLASFQVLLHRLTGQEELVVGAVTDSRRRHDFDPLIGYFLNTLVLRTRANASAPFREYLAEVKDVVAGALANGDVPFDRLVRELQPKRDLSRHPYFQVLFSIQPPAPRLEAPWELTQMDISSGASKVDLYLEIDERADRLIARFIYNTDIFDSATIQRLACHWLTILEAAVADPGTRLRDLPLLTPPESAWLDRAAAGPRAAIPDATVHQLFDEQSKRTPQAVAIEHQGRKLTYAQLDEESTALAWRLIEAGVEPGTLVGLCVERSPGMIVALLAILKTGGTYLPIDPSLPGPRIAFMMEDSKAPVIVAGRALAGRFEGCGTHIISPDEPPKAPRSFPGGVPGSLPEISPGNLAYLMYTSGSTGRPKGVEISHRAVVNLLLSMQREPGFTARDRLLAVTTLSFDIAGLEMYLPLISGGTVIIASKDDARDPSRLAKLLRASRATVMQATPASWRALIDSGWQGDSNLKALCGGEALPRDLAQALVERCGELWNVYGPTETTIWSTVERVSANHSAIRIGRPIANTDVFILDANLKRLPIGVTGDLYIGGEGLARGYFARPELTAEKFIRSPFDPAQRLYRTGDLARWFEDGTIECLGRADHQVKVRGFRIEVEEIEASIRELPGVADAAVKAWPDAAGSMGLTAYVVATRKFDVRAELQMKLPDYMIPARVQWMDALPLNPSGKLDRNALAEVQGGASVAPLIAPRNPVERRLAKVFASVLDLDQVSVTDSFFDLGGHSLLVAKLLRAIEMEFGKRFSMPAVFQSPTVEQLAMFLDDRPSQARPRVVNIQYKYGSAPLFWIRGGPYLRKLQPHMSTPVISVALDPREEQ